jgi:hypothetical protein
MLHAIPKQAAKTAACDDCPHWQFNERECRFECSRFVSPSHAVANGQCDQLMRVREGESDEET